MIFSRRLAFGAPENAWSALHRRRLAAGEPVLDLTVSNPTAVGLPDRGAAITGAFARPGLERYQPSAAGPQEARALVAEEYGRTGGRVPADRILLTASSSESYALLFKLLADPGEAVLVPEPSYPLFDYLARLEGLAPRPYRLACGGGEWAIDWSSFTLDGARAIVLCNPNNPTGSFLRRGDFARLTALALAAGVPLIVDEVFADYAFAPAADAVTTVAAEGALPLLTFCLGGLSKSAGLPQMKLGWIAALGPEAAAREALARLELVADTYLSVATPVLRALPDLLAVGNEIRADIRARVEANRAALAAALPRDAPLTALPAEGGWSAVLRLPAVHSDEEWALALLGEDGVLVQPGYLFDLHAPPSTVVLSLLTSPEIFIGGVAAMVARVSRGS